MQHRKDRIKEQLFTNKSKYAGLHAIDFDIKETDRVLDVGGGNKPFKCATHIIDLIDADNQRHNQKIEVGDREFLNGTVEDVLPSFEDNYFDFCYSSHTFEHIDNLPRALELISAKCKRGFFALPASDFEFLTAKSSFHHVNLCRLIKGNLHIAKRPENAYIDDFAQIFEKRLWGFKKFKKAWEGNDQDPGYRFIWEARHYWEEKIAFTVHKDPETLFPQLEFFKYQSNHPSKHNSKLLSKLKKYLMSLK